MRDIMKELDHRYIDVLKIDVEGAEFPWLRYEGADIIPRVGKFLVLLYVCKYVCMINACNENNEIKNLIFRKLWPLLYVCTYVHMYVMYVC